MSYFQYWGKFGYGESAEPHLLPYHQLDVAAAGMALFDSMHLPPAVVKALGGETVGLRSLVCYFLSLHDLGKFWRSFQALREDGHTYGLVDARLAQGTYGIIGHHTHATLWWWKDRVQPLFMNLLQTRVRSLGKEEKDENWTTAAEELSDVLFLPFAGHHGLPVTAERGFSGQYNGSLKAGSGGESNYEEDAAAVLSFADHVADLLLSDSALDLFIRLVETGSQRVMRYTTWYLAGLAVAADWIGSDERWFPFRSDATSLRVYWDWARSRAKGAVSGARLQAAVQRKALNVRDVLPTGAEARPLQQVASTMDLDSGPNLIIAEDLTGSGKTEAAFLLGNRLQNEAGCNGIYIGLPTQATANQMYTRTHAAIGALFEPGEPPTLVLSHGSRSRSGLFLESIGTTSNAGPLINQPNREPVAAYCSAWIAQSNKRALLANVGVGTVDQALLSVLPIKHQSLRFYGLAGKVLVLDEVHAYDAYTSVLIECAVAFHAALGGSIVLLSATLPARTKANLIAAFQRVVGGDDSQDPGDESGFPAITHVSARGIRVINIESAPRLARTIHFPRVASPEEGVKRMLADARQGRAVCYIRNTVKAAQETYRHVCDEYDPENVVLFHSRFAVTDRADIEAEVLRRVGCASGPSERAGLVVIGTQVIEQSLDIDFDLMLTDLAPVDLLIQRAGRVKRHIRDTEGRRLSGGSDARGPVELMVVGPSTQVDSAAEWLSAARTLAPVYRRFDILWRSTALVDEMGQVVLPRESREVTERVYGEMESVPEEVDIAAENAIGKQQADSAFARSEIIDFDQGYSVPGYGMRSVMDEEIATTRLIDAKQLCLVRNEGGRPAPYGREQDDWESGLVSVPRGLYERVIAAAGTIRFPREEMVDRSRLFRFVEAIDVSSVNYDKELGFQEVLTDESHS
ncbi:MAG: CRISPR-associated helicase Cas3' [Alkalispirochaeta sp.]